MEFVWRWVCSVYKLVDTFFVFKFRNCYQASLSGKSILCKTVGPTEDTLEGVIDAALSHTATVAFIDLETHMDSAFGSSDFRNLDYSCAATS